MDDQRERLIEAKRKLMLDFPLYAEKCLTIRAAAEYGAGLIPFKLRAIQRRVHDAIQRQLACSNQVRLLVLKARQPGISTYVAGRFYWRVTHSRGARAFILTHEQPATNNLFDIVKRFHDYAPELVKPSVRASNTTELDFGAIDSGYRVGTAGTKGVGRSDTINFFHGSEVARWPHASEHASGILQAVPEGKQTEIVLESTAYGFGGLFYDMCRAAEAGDSEYELLFLPWYAHEEYAKAPPEGWRPPAAFADYGKAHQLSMAQLYFAYSKNREMAAANAADPGELFWLFHQEYPATAADAFQAAGGDTLVPAQAITRARLGTLPPPSESVPLILGVDVARGGSDKTRIIDRRGRHYGHNINEKIDTPDLMEVAGYVARAIKDLEPDKVFIDGTGGYGSAVYDRLCELGFRKVVVSIEFGGKSMDPGKYANKRAEMWAALRDQLAEPGGCDLVDDTELHRHIAAPGYRFDSAGRLVLERKEDIKKRLGFSPDGGDAAALTHAEPVAARDHRPVRPREISVRPQPQGGGWMAA